MSTRSLELSLERTAVAIASIFSLFLQPCIVCSAHDSNSVYPPHIIDRSTAQVKRPGLCSVFRRETRMNRNSFTYPSHTFSKITGYTREQYRRVLYSAIIVTYRGGGQVIMHASHVTRPHGGLSCGASFVVGSRVLSYIVARLLSAGVGAC